MNVAQEIQRLAERNADEIIPKPEAKAPFRIKGMGKRRGEPALIYTISSHTGSKPYEKGVTLSEFDMAYRQLQQTGSLERAWFNKHMMPCAKAGSCNFTTIGGVFDILGVAKYDSRGRYISKI